jgi:hypothetical protein
MKKLIVFLFLISGTIIGVSQTGTNVVISQVYGGGGNTGSVYINDFIELFNPTASAISLNGWSVQYNSATGTGAWQVTNLANFSLLPGQYYLIQEAAGTGGTTALPTPNATGTIAMSGTAGKVALVNNTTALNGNCPTGLIDLVGFGSTATCFEGAGPTVAPSNSNSVIRSSNGCTDANNNSTDFSSVLAAPRNSSSPINICGAALPSLVVTGTISDFGNITVGNNSGSQNFSLSGSNLTGAPGTITITAPSTDFQVSNNNSSWGASTTITYATASLSATLIYVRFSPQSAGFKSGTITITGGGIATAVTVPVSGTGLAPLIPTITTGSLLGFGSICVSVTAGPNSFAITGTNLNTNPVTIGILAGYTFATSSAGPYLSNLSIPQPGGSFSQTIFVKFTPTAVSNYNGNILVGGGGITGTIPVAVTGSGDNTVPALTTGTAAGITTSMATCGGSITSNGCTNISSYGIEYSTVNGFTPGTGTKIPSVNLSGGSFTSNLTGLQSGTAYYFRAYAINGGGTGYGPQANFATAYPTLVAGTLTDFGGICITTLSNANSFTLTGTGLNNTNLNIGPLSPYSFSTSLGGTYTPSLSITQPGGNYLQTIFVKLLPTALTAYNGNIPVSGGGSLPFIVAVTGTGVNTVPTMATGTGASYSANTATVTGSISSIGCSPVIAYGVEYSGINGFANGTGKKVTGINLINGNFSALLNGLVQNTTYYYKVYGVNNGGAGYSVQQSFTTGLLPEALVIYSNPVAPGGKLHFSMRNIKPGHYAAQVLNTLNQVVYQKEMIVGVDFIDVTLDLPAKIPVGVYHLRLGNVEMSSSKYFAVQ